MAGIGLYIAWSCESSFAKGLENGCELIYSFLKMVARAGVLVNDCRGKHGNNFTMQAFLLMVGTKLPLLAMSSAIVAMRKVACVVHESILPNFISSKTGNKIEVVGPTPEQYTQVPLNSFHSRKEMQHRCAEYSQRQKGEYCEALASSEESVNICLNRGSV